MQTVVRPLARRLSLAACATLVASAAVAEDRPLGSAVAAPYTEGKSEAILGAPSRLSAILAGQAGQRPLALSPTPALVPAPQAVGTPFRLAIQTVDPKPVSDRRPDVFGTVALDIGKSPLDRRWRAVARGTAGPRAERYARELTAFGKLARLDAVNRYVNRRVTYVSDAKQFGVEDIWSSGASTLSRGRGDCEDFAIAKLQMLRRAGFADKDLYLVILRDTARRADHAVLVARAEGRLLVLDNGTDRIVDSAMLRDYRPILTFAGNHVWTHGYRQAPATLEYASADRPVIAFAADNRIVPAPSGAAD